MIRKLNIKSDKVMQTKTAWFNSSLFEAMLYIFDF